MDTDRILALWAQREKDRGPRLARDREMSDYMGGKPPIVIDSEYGPAVANLMLQGMTAQAQRIGSTTPMPVFATKKKGVKAAERRAKNKRSALLGMWDENVLALQRRQRARWLITYACSPVQVRPTWDARKRQWSVLWVPRTALGSYPAPMQTHLDMLPHDHINATNMAASKIEALYPDKQNQVRAYRGYKAGEPRDHTLTLVEYNGPNEIVLLCVGAKNPYDQNRYNNAYTVGAKWAVELERIENRVGRCTVVTPNGIALEDPTSSYYGMIGMHQMQVKLMDKEYRYVSNMVDPPVYLFEGENGGDFVPADGPAGVVGRVPAGANLQAFAPPPGVATNNMIDRLERGQRVEGGVSADLSGESGSNIRTGRRGQDILSAVMDFPIQEAQELLAQSQKLEDDLAMEIALAYFPDVKRSWGGFEFTPADVFEKDDWHTVEYASPGTDANGLTIRVGQLNGIDLMSKATARTLIPDIKDPEFEADQVVFESIAAGILAEFATPGSFTLPDKARVMQLVREDKMELAEAVIQVQREAQERQAADVNPVAPGSPEAQPGIAPPGAGAEAGVVGPTPDLAGLTSLAGALRLGQRAAPQEAMAEAAAGAR